MTFGNMIAVRESPLQRILQLLYSSRNSGCELQENPSITPRPTLWESGKWAAFAKCDNRAYTQWVSRGNHPFRWSGMQMCTKLLSGSRSVAHQSSCLALSEWQKGCDCEKMGVCLGTHSSALCIHDRPLEHVRGVLCTVQQPSIRDPSATRVHR